MVLRLLTRVTHDGLNNSRSLAWSFSESTEGIFAHGEIITQESGISDNRIKMGRTHSASSLQLLQ